MTKHTIVRGLLMVATMGICSPFPWHPNEEWRIALQALGSPGGTAQQGMSTTRLATATTTPPWPALFAPSRGALRAASSQVTLRSAGSVAPLKPPQKSLSPLRRWLAAGAGHRPASRSASHSIPLIPIIPIMRTIVRINWTPFTVTSLEGLGIITPSRVITARPARVQGGHGDTANALCQLQHRFWIAQPLQLVPGGTVKIRRTWLRS